MAANNPFASLFNNTDKLTTFIESNTKSNIDFNNILERVFLITLDNGELNNFIYLYSF